MFIPEPLKPGSIYDMLARYAGFVIQASDFPETDPTLGGNRGHCVVLLSKLVLLWKHFGLSDREASRRACMDLQFKACLGLGLDQKGPSAATLCRHRRWMEELGLDELYSTRFNELLVAAELVKRNEPVLVDSVPINGAGQQLDSYNLLAGSIRQGLRELAKSQERSIDEVAERLGLSAYAKRSVKGHFDIDWQNDDSRRAFLVQLVTDARRVSALLAEHDVSEDEQPDDGFTSPMTEARETIEQVIAHDVEFTQEGEVQGIRQVPAGDRLISLTDRDMRHGRKSASVLISGYKAQVVASAVYGFILMSKVIKANEHDGQALPSLAHELDAQNLAPQWWAGDHAYGTLANHHTFRAERRGELVARMPRPGNGGRFTKDEFDYDFEQNTLTCPTGLTVIQKRWQTRDQKKGRLFEFPVETCAGCAHSTHRDHPVQRIVIT